MNDDSTKNAVEKDLDDLVEEFLEALRNGDCPDMDDFAGRHPEHASELKDILPLLVSMEQAGGERKGDAEDKLPNLEEAGFRVLKKIGGGGMGEVYEAEQVLLGRHVAVKTLRSSSPLTAERVRQFERESVAIAKLYHPGIVQVYSAGRCGNIFYYAMELVHGKGLDEARPEGLRQTAAIGLQAAEALAYAHRCGILHRDIKPANILMDDSGRIYIGDFGLASILNEEEGDGIFHGGTLRYMSPERVSDGICTVAGDQYALGATLYELISGKPLLTADSSERLAELIKAGDIAELACSEADLTAIVMKSLRKEPKERYPSVDDMADDLRNFLEGRPVTAAAPSVMRRFWLWSRRNPALASALLVAGMACVAFVVALAVGYVRTKHAWRQAKHNADVAEQALQQVFTFVENRPPSTSSTRLLSLLLPYYQYSLEQKGLDDDKLMEARRVIGSHALRTGNYELAEDAYRKMLDLRQLPDVMNKLASILRKTGRNGEADAMQEKLVETYRNSTDSTERLEAFLALKAMAVSQKDNENIRNAFNYLGEMLKAEPQSTQLRYQYALLLEEHPGLFHRRLLPGLEPNAGVILRDLAEHYPEQPEYAAALVRRMTKTLRRKSLDSLKEEDDLTLALSLSERLLATFTNVPETVVVVVDFRNAYIEALRRGQKMSDARRERERLISSLRGRFFSEDTPNELRDALLSMQLQQLQLAVRDKRPADRIVKELHEELNAYHGDRKAEFAEKLAALTGEPK